MKNALLICFLLFLGSLSGLYAQADLEINIVSAADNQPISSLKIQLKNPQIGFSAERLTNEQGKVKFSALSTSGEYQVFTEENEEFYPMESNSFVLRSQQKSSVSLLVPNKKTVDLDEIVVEAGSSVSKINTVNAEVSAELRIEEIQSLPIEGRDITRALFRLPNVTQATGFYPEAPNVSINGANSLFTNYLIDGLDNNERFLGGQKFAIPVGFTQNINVLTNNYSTEFGLTGNGIVNITTRSGSNELTGEAFYVLRPGTREILGIQFDASSPFAQRDLSGNQVKDGFQRHQFGFGLGGPIIKDKTFYYINFEQTFDLKDNLLNSPALGVNESVQGENRFSYLSAKIDHLWSQKLRSSVRVNLGLIGIERQGGGLEGGVSFPSTGNTQNRNSLIIANKNAYLGNNFVVETNFQYARFVWDYAEADNINSPNVTVLDPDGFTAAVLGHPGFVFNEIEHTYQFQQKVTFFANKHTFKAGFDLISANHELFGGGNPNGSYTVRLNESQLQNLRNQNLGSSLGIQDIPSDVEVLNYGIELRPQSFGGTQNIYSFYLEDLFNVTNRLNLTLGLRYDYDNLSKGGNDQGDFNNLAPRFNFNYRLGERSTLRGGYGLFYEKILYAVYSDALQQNSTNSDYRLQLQEFIDLGLLPADTDLDQITFEGNLGAGFANPDFGYLQGPSADALQSERENIFSNERRILNPEGYDNPYTHQFSLGYQYQVDQKTLFYVDLVHTRSFNLFRLRNLNAPSPFINDDPENIQVRSPQEADLTRPIPIADNSAVIDGQTVTGIARNVVVSETAGRSEYWGLSMNLVKDKGEDDKFAYRFSYTLSELKNDTEDINFRAEDSNNFDREWAISINDRTHVLNALFFYYPLNHLSLNLAGLLQSGQPINRIPIPQEVVINGNTTTTTDLNGDGQSFGDTYVGNSDRFPGEARNNDRLPWSFNFDVGVQYQIPIQSSALELRMDVFNVFNVENLSGFSNNATQSNQLQAGSKASGVLVRRNAGPPRQFQLSVRYAF